MIAGLSRVLVTGATGFIGRHFCKRLLADGVSVVSLQRRRDGAPPGVAVALGDLAATDLLESLPCDLRFDAVVHLAAFGVHPAARDEHLMRAINIDGTRRLAELAAARGARAMVIAGSGSEYDLASAVAPVAESHPVLADGSYGASKAAGNAAALAVAERTGLSMVVGRLFNVYGPGEAPHRLLPSLVRSLRQDEPVALSAGTQLRDFLHVTDAAEALRALLEAACARAGCHVVNVATGEPVPVRRFCELSAEAMGKPASLLRFGQLPLRQGETMLFSGDPAKLRALTGWSPRISLREGLGRAIAEMLST